MLTRKTDPRYSQKAFRFWGRVRSNASGTLKKERKLDGIDDS